MNELEKFKKVWNGYFHKSKFWGGKNYSRRGTETKKRYEDVLFSIWKHHNDWDERNGFQIKCFKKNIIYRVVNLALKSGLLIKTRNYYAGDHTNEYHKNNKLFNLVFQNKNNDYGNWLNEVTSNKDKDIIFNLLQDEFNNIGILNNKHNNPYVFTKPKTKRLENKINKLPYDLKKLYKISDKMLKRYYKLMLQLNKSAVHDDFKFFNFLHYDNNGLPTGRPYSYFCSTGNDNKIHKDQSLELRKDFLKKIGLGDYYEVYDIKSQVPRVNWLFHTGQWKDDKYDFYSEIVKDTEMEKYLDWKVQRGETKYTEYDDSMKQLFMRIYFGKGTDRQSYNGYLNNKLDRVKNGYKKYWNDVDDKLDIDFDIWKELCNSTKKIVGKPLGNLVFWFSFFIETEVKIELLKRGKKVYNVYDGFYYNKDIKNEIKKLIKEKANYVYINYMKPIKK